MKIKITLEEANRRFKNGENIYGNFHVGPYSVWEEVVRENGMEEFFITEKVIATIFHLGLYHTIGREEREKKNTKKENIEKENIKKENIEKKIEFPMEIKLSDCGQEEIIIFWPTKYSINFPVSSFLWSYKRLNKIENLSKDEEYEIEKKLIDILLYKKITINGKVLIPLINMYPKTKCEIS